MILLISILEDNGVIFGTLLKVLRNFFSQNLLKNSKYMYTEICTYSIKSRNKLNMFFMALKKYIHIDEFYIGNGETEVKVSIEINKSIRYIKKDDPRCLYKILLANI